MRNNLEQKIKDRLLSNEVSLDMDNVWANISPSLPKPKKRNRLFLLLTFGLVLTSAGLLTWSLNGNEMNTGDFVANSNVSEIVSSDIENVDSRTENNQQEELIDEIPDGNSKTNNVVSPQGSITSIESKGRGNTVLNSDAEEGLNHNYNKGDSNLEFEEALFPEMNKDRDFLALEYVARIHSFVNFERSKIDLKLIDTPTQSIKPIRTQSSSLSLLVGYYMMRREFLSEGSGFENEFERRNDSEKALDAFRFSTLYSRSLFGNIDGYIGLAYQKSNESNAYSDTTYSYTPTLVLIERIYESDGSVTDIVDTVDILETTVSMGTRYNSYQSWRIPVGVTTSWNKDKLGCHLGLGLDAVLSKSIEGLVYHNDSYYDISTDHEQIINTGLDFDLNISAGLSYDIHPNYSVLFSSRAIIPLKGIYANNYGIRHKQYLFGLDMGVQYKF